MKRKSLAGDSTSLLFKSNRQKWRSQVMDGNSRLFKIIVVILIVQCIELVIDIVLKFI